MLYFVFLSIMLINSWYCLKLTHLPTHANIFCVRLCHIKGIWPKQDYMLFLKFPQTFKVKQKQSYYKNKSLVPPKLPGASQHSARSDLSLILPCLGPVAFSLFWASLLSVLQPVPHMSTLFAMKTPLGLEFFFCSDCFLESIRLHCFYGCPLLERK